VEHKLGIYPVVDNIDVQHYETEGKGGKKHVVHAYAYVSYQVVDLESGDAVQIKMVGEASDYGDKAFGKAMSYAYKVMVFQLFCVPFEDIEDPDETSRGNGPRSGSTRPQSAPGNDKPEARKPDAGKSAPPQKPEQQEQDRPYKLTIAFKRYELLKDRPHPRKGTCDLYVVEGVGSETGNPVKLGCWAVQDNQQAINKIRNAGEGEEITFECVNRDGRAYVQSAIEDTPF
jgi:hypothetical protein